MELVQSIPNKKNIKQFLLEQPRLEELHEGNLAYIAAEKESTSGMFNNLRFVFINGKDLSLGYSNDLPEKIPIGSFHNIKYIKKKAYLGDVLIQRSKHKLKAIEIIVQKFKYKDRQEKIPQQWVFFVSSTKAADDTVQLFNKVKAEALGKISLHPLIQPSLVLMSQVKGEKQIYSPQRSSVSNNNNHLEVSPESSARRRSQMKITPQPVVQISINNRPINRPSLSINPAFNVVSKPKYIMYSQANNRYQLQQTSVPAYYNQTTIIQPSNVKTSTLQLIQVPVYSSNYQASQNSIQYPVTHHDDSIKMPQSYVKKNLQVSSSGKYEIQLRPVEKEPSVYSSYTKYSHPNNSVMTNKNIPIVIQVSQKQSTSQKSQSKQNSNTLFLNNPPSTSGLVVNIDSSRKTNNAILIQQPPISPIQKRKRTKTRYDIDNSNAFSNSQSPNSPHKNSISKQKLHNVWEQQSPSLIDFTLKSSPVKNRNSPTKLATQPNPDEHKSNKRRQTVYSIAKNYKDWNQQLYFSIDPLDTIMKFKQFSSQIAMQIINSFGSLDDKYHVLKSQQGFIVYQHQNLILTVAFNPDSDKQSIKTLQNNVENYIYMNSVLQNKQFCRVPLVNLIKYKGIIIFIKASLGNSTKINKNSLSSQIKKLEHATKIPRQQFTNCNFKLVTYFNRGTSSQIIYIDDVEQLIPSSNKCFRKQLILMASKQKGLIESLFLIKLLQKQIDKFVTDIENLQTIVLSSEDLQTQLHKYGIAKQQLGIICNKATLDFSKQIFTSQLLSETATELFFTHLQNQIKSLAKKKQRHSDRYLIQASYEFMDDLCSATNNSQALWDVINNDTQNKYKVRLERRHLMWGYFLSAFLFKAGLKFNFNSLDKSSGFSQQYNCINAHSLEGFLCRSISTNFNFVQSVANTKSILQQIPSQYGYQKLRVYIQNSTFLNYIKDQPQYFNQLLIYLSNFIPSDITTKTVVNPYQSIPYEPSNLTNIRLNLSKLKWLLKHKDEQSAVTLLQQTCQYISFWGAQFHPLLSQLYDLLASYYVGCGQSQQALTLAKSSLVNIIKLVGNDSLAAADKFYFLANVMFNIGKYQQAFSNFSKAREILLQQSLNNTILGKIQLKMSILYLHFDKYSDSEMAAKEALDVFEQNKQQLYLVQTYQLLDRLYKTQNNMISSKQNAIECSSKLQSSRNQQVYCRVLKLCINPFLSQLSPICKKSLLETIQMMNISQPRKDYFAWLFKKNNVVQTLVNYIKMMDQLIKEMKISNIQKYKGINVKSDNQLFNFLAYMEAVIGVIDSSSITGVLRIYE